MAFTDLEAFDTDILQYYLTEDYNMERVTLNYVAAGSRSKGEVLAILTSTGNYRQVATSGSDGTQTAAAVLMQDVTVAANTDLPRIRVLKRGPAIVIEQALTYPTGATAPQITAINGQLDDLGIVVRDGV